MNDVDVTSPKLRRNRALAWVAKAAAVGVVVVFVAVSYLALLLAIKDLTSSQRQTQCRQQLLAYTFQNVARAFNAPDRDAAVNDIIRSADRYADAEKVCASGGRPDPLPPTPIPTTQGVTP
jgi:hypothetical protein